MMEMHIIHMQWSGPQTALQVQERQLLFSLELELDTPPPLVRGQRPQGPRRDTAPARSCSSIFRDVLLLCQVLGWGRTHTLVGVGELSLHRCVAFRRQGGAKSGYSLIIRSGK